MERPRVFKDNAKLTHMLNLRLEGMTERYLAGTFGCARPNIRYHFRKYGVFPWVDESINLFRVVDLLSLELFKNVLADEKKWIYISGERVNTGKNYSDYLKESISLHKGANVS